MDSFKDLLAETVGQIKLMIQQRFGRAADEGDQKHKFNQVHKLMKKANIDQFNFTLKVVETIDSAKSAAENAQQEILKLDLTGEKLIWILLADKYKFGWGTVEEYKQNN